MEPIPEKHLRMYNDSQKRLLQQLFDAIQNQKECPVFVCDRNPGGEYLKAVNYPLYVYEGGNDYFLLAAEKVKKHWISYFNHTSIEVVGKITWKFRYNKFTRIVIFFDRNKKPPEALSKTTWILLDLFKNCAINTASSYSG